MCSKLDRLNRRRPACVGMLDMPGPHMAETTLTEPSLAGAGAADRETPRAPRLILASLIALAAVGCTSSGGDAPSASLGAGQPAFGRDRLIGRWGIASYH